MKTHSKSSLQVIGSLVALGFSGCLAGDARIVNKQSIPQPAITIPSPAPTSSQLPNTVVTNSFIEGAEVGYTEGKSWGRGGSNGLPQAVRQFPEDHARVLCSCGRKGISDDGAV